jgi:general secretion pathway protein K
MKRSRGIALILALVVVALATILATRIGSQGALNQRRGATLLAQEQAFEVALGAEDWAMEVLRDSPAQNQRASLDQAWATPLPPIPIDGGTVAGPPLEDMQGRFNLNSLVNADGSKNPIAFAQFQRLLTALEIEPKWASMVLDWIDPDNVPDGVDGAEDSVYLSQNPPSWTSNHLMTTSSELLALPGFGIERYQKLKPYVAALPLGTPLNVCTASGIVLDSLAPGLVAFGMDAKSLAANRQKGCFPLRNDVEAALAPLVESAPERQLIVNGLAETTSWFRATIVVSIGTTQLTLYSLLQRNPSGYSRVILRTLGTE